MTVREQEKMQQRKMQQRIEKQQETKLTKDTVTVMFHDRKAFLAVSELFRARANAAPSLSGSLTIGVLFVLPVPSLPSSLKVSASGAHPRHRTRRRTTLIYRKFSAEVPDARSARFIFGANPNSRSEIAAATIITTKTERRRCKAA